MPLRDGVKRMNSGFKLSATCSGGTHGCGSPDQPLRSIALKEGTDGGTERILVPNNLLQASEQRTPLILPPHGLNSPHAA